MEKSIHPHRWGEEKSDRSGFYKLRQWFGVFLLICTAAFPFTLPYFPLESDRPVDLPFFEKSPAEAAFIYFGYLDCSQSCPVSMAVLADFYQSIGQPENFKIAYVNLDYEIESWMTEGFAAHYHPAFLGYQPEKAELQRWESQFGLNVRRNEASKALSHQGRIYLVQKQQNKWKIVSALNDVSINQTNLKNLYFTSGGKNAG